MVFCSIDLETSSHEPLQKIGAEAYARGRTITLLLAFHVIGDPAPPLVWRRGEPPPRALCEHVHAGGLFCGWNVIGFDRLVYKYDLVARCGFPPITEDRWIDSMHRAAAANLPRSLAGCARAVGVEFTEGLKDRGKLLRITNAARTPTPSAEDLAWLQARCAQDVLMEEATLLRLPPWIETAPWRDMPRIDREINDRGVLMDVALVRGLAHAAARETARLDRAMHQLTEGQVPKTTTVEALKRWLIARGVELAPNAPAKDDEEEEEEEEDDEKPGGKGTKSPWRLRKSDIADLLARPDIPEPCRQALEWRAEAAKASVRKLTTMLAAASPDGRLRGTLILGGAQQTFRFSSGRTQTHNYVRDAYGNAEDVAEQNGLDPKKERARVAALSDLALHTAITAGRTGDPELLRGLFQVPRTDQQARVRVEGVLPFVSRMMRRTLTAPAGKLFLSGDFSAIEARIPVWLAGQDDMVQAFARGEDVYRRAASPVYGLAPEQLTKEQRQIGKVMVLFLGFAGGVNAFLPAAMNYGLRIPRETGVDIVRVFRETNTALVAFWKALMEGAINATINPGHDYGVAPKGLITWHVAGDCLFCRLPSGRVLRYWQPRLRQGFWPDGEPMQQPQLTTLVCKGKAVFRRSLWRGLACLGEKTQVRTYNGRKNIIDVRITDKVWDGENWVSHGGVVAQGVRETLSFGGIRMTPDHKVDIDGQWVACGDTNYEDAVLSLLRKYQKTNWRRPISRTIPRSPPERWQQPVFDILNAGPNRRFTIRGADNQSILVSNCENVTQAIAADLLANALVQLDAADFATVLHVHDSVTAEVEANQAEALLPGFKQCMLTLPAWTAGLPMDAHCDISTRFG